MSSKENARLISLIDMYVDSVKQLTMQLDMVSYLLQRIEIDSGVVDVGFKIGDAILNESNKLATQGRYDLIREEIISLMTKYGADGMDLVHAESDIDMDY